MTLKQDLPVLHQIMIIGEATKRLGPDFTKNNPVLPWKEIAGSRDILIHHYEEVDLEIVWNIVIHQLPKVKKEIRKLLK